MSHHRLAARFGRGAFQIAGREPLDDGALRAAVPSVFAEGPHDSRSGRYVHVPTITLVSALRREGWQPFFAAQAKPRDDDRLGHAKHILRLRRAADIGAGEAAEVVIVNSHDGTSAYQMFAGLIRFVCLNSLVAGERFEEVRVPHKGDIRDRIVEGAYTVAKDFPRLLDAAAEMRGTALAEPERRAFAEAALVARYGDANAPVRPEQVVEPRRRADADASLWSAFNTAQEHLVRGGLDGRRLDARGRTRRVRTRAINGIDGSVSLNRALWTLAERMREIKQAA